MSISYLTPLGLAAYASTFDAEGYNKRSFLKGITLAELKGDLNMKTGHAKMLLRWLSEITAKEKEDDAGYPPKGTSSLPVEEIISITLNATSIGQMLELEISATMTVLELKGLMTRDYSGGPALEQRIVVAGCVLPDDEVLADAGVEESSVVLWIRTRVEVDMASGSEDVIVNIVINGDESSGMTIAVHPDWEASFALATIAAAHPRLNPAEVASMTMSVEDETLGSDDLLDEVDLHAGCTVDIACPSSTLVALALPPTRVECESFIDLAIIAPHTHFSISVDFDAHIGRVKELIGEELDVEASTVTLVFCGEPLVDDEETVGECGLDEGTALNAFVRGVKVARPASLAAAAAAAGGGGGGTAESVFCIFDDDETGRISFKNLKRVAKELGSKMTDEALQEIIDAGDLDGDGEWSLKEFFDLMILKMTAGASSGWGGGGGGLSLREAFHLCGGDVGGVTLASGTAAAEQQKLIDKALGWGKHFRLVPGQDTTPGAGEHPGVKGEVLLVFDDIAGAGDTVNEQQFVSILRAPVLAAISFLVQEKQAGILDSLPFDQDQREASRDVIASVMDGIPRIQASVPALAHSLFRFFDSNGDGKISRVEIEAAVDLLESANRTRSDSELLHDMKPFLLKVLALADLDGSGTIDLEDIQLLAEQLITLVDDVGTGAVEILDHAVASPVIAKAITQPFNAGLRELDQDHSGTLSADEIPFLAGLVAEGRNQIKQLVARAGESSNEFGPVKISPILKCAQQYVADIIDGLKNIKDEFSYMEMARMAAWDGGVPEHLFVRCLCSAAHKQRESSLTAVRETRAAFIASIEQDGAPPVLTSFMNNVTERLSAQLLADAGGPEDAITSKFASALYNFIDLNGDGVLSWDEIDSITALVHGLNPSTSDAEVDLDALAATVFSIVDVDKSGDVTKEEFAFLVDKVKHFGMDVAKIFVQIICVAARALVGLISDKSLRTVIEEIATLRGEEITEEITIAWDALEKGVTAEQAFGILRVFVKGQ